MPGYEIIGFYNNTGSPWYGEDALHCRTMGIFDPNMIHISHKSIRTEEIYSNSSIYVEVEIIDYNNSNVNLESVTLNWKYSSADGPFTVVNLQIPNSSIEYFIEATNLEGHTASNPNAGWHNFDTLQYILGDINTDGIINIQDIVLAVSLILATEYSDLADLNLDGIVDVLDIVQLINVILD